MNEAQRMKHYSRGLFALVVLLAACGAPPMRTVERAPQQPQPQPQPQPRPPAPIVAPSRAPIIVTPAPAEIRPPVAVQPPVVIAKPTVPPSAPSLVPSQPIHTSLRGKMVVGYQGWFGCPGDFEDNQSWRHWFLNSDRSEDLLVDQLPSVRGFAESDLCPTSLKRADGSRIFLFSSQNPRVVATHFRQMQQHGIDGAAVQRFVVEFNDARALRRVDNVLRNVRAAAEASGRAFYITYDVSGANDATVVEDVRRDWQHLVNESKILESPMYLYDNGKPVLQLWGFGFEGRPGEVGKVAALINDLKRGANGLRATTLIGGVPTYWRTLSEDAKKDAAWRNVYLSYDVISPWSVGRYADDAGADRFVRDLVVPDIATARAAGIRYMPVMFPGFSWRNLMAQNAKLGRPTNAANLNSIPRQCGNFLWTQASNLINTGVETIYVAMFDEVDEATALMPTEARREALPHDASMIYLNNDGCTLPEDWYLNVTGKAAQFLKAKRATPKRLNSVVTP
jgi:hypothetical protein